MPGILERKRFSSLDRPIKMAVIFQPEAVIVFRGSPTSTEGVVEILNRTGEPLQYSVKSNNKHAYKVKEPKGTLSPTDKTSLFFIALKHNQTEQEMVTGDRFRIDVWKKSKPSEILSQEYKVALKDDQGLQDNDGFMNDNVFSTMIQNSKQTGTFASFSARQQVVLGKMGAPKPRNKIVMTEQKQQEKMGTRMRSLQQQISKLKDVVASEQRKHMCILEQREDRLVKYYLMVVIVTFVVGIGLRWVSGVQELFF